MGEDRVFETLSSSEAATEALGEALGSAIEAGDVIALTGPLGAGKTRLVSGLARGALAPWRVRSPSFTLVNEYAGRVRVLHLDLYRVEGADAEGLGLDEMRERGALVVEWGEKLPRRWLADALRIEITPLEATLRRVRAEAEEPRAVALLEAWRARCATSEAAS